MTDGHQNSGEPPDEDWAMSEEKIPVVKEPDVKPIDEVAAKLYSPPDTGDLEDWDLSPSDGFAAENAVQNPPQKPTERNFEAMAFMPPINSIEIIKPLIISEVSAGDWTAGPPSNDGWKMPKPIFRGSGRSDSTGANQVDIEFIDQNSEIPNDSLQEIYAPPEDKGKNDVGEELSFSQDAEVPAESLESDSWETDSLDSDSTVGNPETVLPAKKSKAGLVLWGLLIIVFFAVILVGGVFAVFYYTARH